MNNILSILGGLGLLVIGAELLVRGSVQIAQRMGLSPLIIGLTLVGFGTSTPELVTSVNASLAGSPGIAIGNVVGSNIFNILGILGFAALVSPIVVPKSALWRDGALVVASAAVLTACSFAGTLDRIMGLGFIAALVAYLVYAYRQDRACAADEHTAAYGKGAAVEGAVSHMGAERPQPSEAASLFASLTTAIGGLALVVFGADYLVEGAVALARGWGVSETVIGLTIVAVGTSLPELITSAVAAFKKQSDIALGNVLGSNIYNIFGILGITTLIAPAPVPADILWRDNFVMLAVSALAFALAWTGLRIGRREGAILMALYVAYVALIWPR